jgi:hypothetical protein
VSASSLHSSNATTQQLNNGSTLRWDDDRAIHLDGDASLEEVDGDDHESFFRSGSDENAFDALEQPLGDSNLLTHSQVGVRQGRDPGLMEALNRGNLTVRNLCQSIPSISQHPRETSCLGDFDVARLVHEVVEEQIPREHGHRGATAGAVSSHPDAKRRQEKLKASLRQLLVDHLLTLTVGPEDVPFGRAELAQMAAGSWQLAASSKLRTGKRFATGRGHRASWQRAWNQLAGGSLQLAAYGSHEAAFRDE